MPGPPRPRQNRKSLPKRDANSHGDFSRSGRLNVGIRRTEEQSVLVITNVSEDGRRRSAL